MSGSCLTAAGRWRSVDCADHVFLSLQLPWQQTITVYIVVIFFVTIFASFISWYALAHANSCQSCWHFHPNNFWTSGNIVNVRHFNQNQHCFNSEQNDNHEKLRLDVSDNLLDAELASVVQGVTRMRSLLRSVEHRTWFILVTIKLRSGLHKTRFIVVTINVRRV